jgi:hypothetical protein
MGVWVKTNTTESICVLPQRFLAGSVCDGFASSICF